jgi:hypothetical protein
MKNVLEMSQSLSRPNWEQHQQTSCVCYEIMRRMNLEISAIIQSGYCYHTVYIPKRCITGNIKQQISKFICLDGKRGILIWGIIVYYKYRMVMKSSIFRDITPYIPLKGNRCFGGTFRLHLQGRPLILRWNVPTKRRLTSNALHGVMSQKIELLIYYKFLKTNCS